MFRGKDETGKPADSGDRAPDGCDAGCDAGAQECCDAAPAAAKAGPEGWKVMTFSLPGNVHLEVQVGLKKTNPTPASGKD